MEGFHHEPRAAGVYVPGHAAASIGEVSGLAKSPSADVLMMLPTLELGKSTSNLSLEGGAPTPKRLDMSPGSPPEVPPTLRDGYSQASMASESLTIPYDVTNVAPATVKMAPPPEMPPGSASSAAEQSTKTEPAEPAVVKTQPPPPDNPESPDTPKVEAPTLDPSAPGESPPVASGAPPGSSGDSQPLEPERNMYNDGTYWRTR